MPKNILTEIKAWAADSAGLAAKLAQQGDSQEDLVKFLQQNSEGWSRTARVISRMSRDIKVDYQKVSMLEEECAALRRQLAAQEQRALYSY